MTENPTYIYKDGVERYYLDGKLHREDGPAVLYDNGVVEYWVNGEELTRDEFDAL